MWKFNGKDLDPAKLPMMEEVISGIRALGGENAGRAAILNWDYGEYGTNVAYGIALTPRTESVVC